MAEMRTQFREIARRFRRTVNGRSAGGLASRTRGSVLVIVMVTLLFATFALLAFLEKASVDLLVDQREAVTRRLRMEAYSALETTLAVLEDFREVGNGLRSPAEGWGEPLVFAGYEPSEGRTVEIAFEDESGKLSLPRVNAQILTNLFFNWGILQSEAEALADAMLGWMKRDHIYATAVVPSYDQGAIPFEAPGRPLRSYHELAAIEKVRETFYDADGRPNEFWKRFVASVSLLQFQRPNINGAKADTLAALGQFDETQQRTIEEYLKGGGSYLSKGPGFFQNPTDAQQIAGPTGDAGAFSTTISALRIFVTVRDGRTEFRLAAVVAPPNGATTVQATATSTRTETSAGSAQTAAQQQNRPNAAQAAPPPTTNQNQTPGNLRYPYTLLEIRENEEIPQPPSLMTP
jgi:general secretion pathway protein K